MSKKYIKIKFKKKNKRGENISAEMKKITSKDTANAIKILQYHIDKKIVGE